MNEIVLSPEEVAVLAGLFFSGFTQSSKFLLKKTGWDIFKPKNLAAIICVVYGAVMAFYIGGETTRMLNTFSSSTMYAWATGQGIYALFREPKG